jgi:hypothetical protein
MEGEGGAIHLDVDVVLLVHAEISASVSRRPEIAS